MFKRGENPNHPARGSRIRTDPIRRRKDVRSIKVFLRGLQQLRNLALFTLGINSALRPEDLRNILVGQVRGFSQTKGSKSARRSQENTAGSCSTLKPIRP